MRRRPKGTLAPAANWHESASCLIPWHRNAALIYSLAVETFMDGDGDGIGDFAGLTRRLDYLESLGVDALWLSPSQPSPNRDHGYDVAYYYGIDSRLATSGDFADFMNEAGERGIRVLMDLVVNHTSETHPWFRDASSRRDSAFRDWYVWSDKRPRNFRSEIVFSRVQKTTWSYARGTRAWYFPTKPAIRRLRDRETNETGQSQSGNLPSRRADQRPTTAMIAPDHSRVDQGHSIRDELVDRLPPRKRTSVCAVGCHCVVGVAAADNEADQPRRRAHPSVGGFTAGAVGNNAARAGRRRGAWPAKVSD